MNGSTTDPYSPIAGVYDQADHIEVTRAFFDSVRPTLEPLSRDGWILDLGCGTGLLTEMAAKASWRVLGVDRSAPMLGIARRRCRKHVRHTRFICADLASFRAGKPCVAACAAADVINHVPSASLPGVFRNIREQLTPGGILVFDTLNRFCFDRYWKDSTYFMESGNGDLVMECDWDEDREAGSVRMIAYVRRGERHEKFETVFEEYLHSNSALRSALREGGFHRVRREPWSPWEDQHLEPSLDRNLWTARRSD